MKVIFISNFFNHHQKQLSDELYRLTEGEYRFFATEKMTDERKSLGWDISLPEYVVEVGDTLSSDRQKEVDEADVVMLGGDPYAFVKNRIKQGKTTFLFTERLFKRKIDILRRIKAALIRRPRWGKKNAYLLCAGAYVVDDFQSIGCFKDRAFKWGYFPPFKKIENIDSLLENKRKNSIMLCSRLIDWKHPELAIEAAKRLKEGGYDFHLEIVGDGYMREEIEKQIEKEDLSNFVSLLGATSFDEVRKKMEETQILLATSDRQEGWGAVLNEGMNAGMAVLASHEIGAAPYLIEDEKNGRIFKCQDVEDMTKKLKWLLDNPKACQEMAQAAYQKIESGWNGSEAAARLLALATALGQGKATPFEEGVCSKAPCIKDDWYKN